ncbi:MAG: phage holin, LLH family [Syntrophomonadaceae bacterium]|jgi:RNA polymerase-interacting CarD/CdnL/TRCF family regulator
MEGKLIPLAYDILAVLIPALVALGIELLRRRIGVEKLQRIQQELQANQQMALLVVKSIEQIWSDKLDGSQKLDEALKLMTQMAAQKGINLKPEEVRMLIEWAVKLMKEEIHKQLPKNS